MHCNDAASENLTEREAGVYACSEKRLREFQLEFT